MAVTTTKGQWYDWFLLSRTGESTTDDADVPNDQSIRYEALVALITQRVPGAPDNIQNECLRLLTVFTQERKTANNLQREPFVQPEEPSYANVWNRSGCGMMSQLWADRGVVAPDA